MFYISCEKEINIDELITLLKQTYWAAERPRELVQKSLLHSVNYGAFDFTYVCICFGVSKI